MAKMFNIEELDSDKVFEYPTIEERDFAYYLLRTSNYGDEQKDAFDNELSDEGLSYNRLNEIIVNLKMNQSEEENPSMKTIQKQIDLKLELDGDD